MGRKLFYIFLCLLLYINSLAFDSKNKLQQQIDSIFKKYALSEPEKVKNFLTEALRESYNSPNGLRRALIHSYLHQIYDLTENYIKAIKHGYNVLLIYQIYNKPKLFDQYVLKLANTYQHANFYDDIIISLLNQIIQKYQNQPNSKDKILLAKTYRLYFNALEGNFNDSLAIKLMQQAYWAKSKITKYQTFYILADYFLLKTEPNYQKAIALLKKIEAEFKHLDTFHLAFIQLKLAQIYIDRDNFRAADKLLDKLIPYFQNKNLNIYLTKALYLKAKIKYASGEYDNALKLAQKALRLALIHEIPLTLADIYALLAEINIAQQRPDLAYYSNAQQFKVKENLFNLREIYEITKIQIHITGWQKEQENQELKAIQKLQESKIKQQQYISLLLGFGVSILILLIILLAIFINAQKKALHRLIQFTQIAQEAILIVEGNKIIEFNDRFIQLTGYRKDEIKNKPLSEFLTPEIISQISAENSKVFLETDIRKKDGSTFRAEIISQPFEQKSKKARVIFILDITEFIKAKEHLKETQKQFKTFLETSPDGVVITDQNGIITFVSKTATQILKLEPQKLINNSLEQILKKYNIQNIDLKQQLQQIQNSNSILEKDLIFKTNNQITYIECRCSPIKDSNGNIKNIIYIFRDVTQKRITEENLRRSEELFRTLFTRASDALVIIDKKGNILKYNPAFKQMFSINDQNQNINILDLIPSSMHKKLIEGIKTQKNFEIPFYKKDKIRYAQISVASLYLKNQEAILLIIRDITELKQQQEQLRKYTEKLKLANESKLKLFSIIAHDLRGTIGNFKSMLELIVDAKDLFNPNEILDSLQLMKNSAVKTYELLENLLQWARTQLEQIEPNPQTIDLAPIVNFTISIFKQAADNKQITIENTLNQQNIKVFADQDMLTTILRNLLSNAIKFTPKKGKITILHYIDTKQNMVIIGVKDTGRGIPNDKLSEIFNEHKFYSTVGTNGETGTGLGLQIVKEFVQKLGGKIWVESKIGKGTTFYFSIPKA